MVADGSTGKGANGQSAEDMEKSTNPQHEFVNKECSLWRSQSENNNTAVSAQRVSTHGQWMERFVRTQCTGCMK